MIQPRHSLEDARPWRLLRTSPRAGAWNMACDHALAEAVAGGESPPVLRFFGWRPQAVSLGYNQHAASRRDALEELRREGIDCVRRPTGGGAVLHADELTYSVAAPVDLPALEAGPSAACVRIHEAILEGLRSLGIEGLELHHVQGARAPSPRASPAAVCFASTSRSEIAWRGRKLVGSAQRVLGRALLQHGSLLLSGDQSRLTRLWEEEMPAGRGTTLAEVGGRPFAVEEVVSAVRAGFERALGVVFHEAYLDPREERRVESLVLERYGREDFVYRL